MTKEVPIQNTNRFAQELFEKLQHLVKSERITQNYDNGWLKAAVSAVEKNDTDLLKGLVLLRKDLRDGKSPREDQVPLVDYIESFKEYSGEESVNFKITF